MIINKIIGSKTTIDEQTLQHEGSASQSQRNSMAVLFSNQRET